MSKKTVTEFRPLTIPTYEPGAPESLPMFFEKKPYQGASGHLYPIPFTTKISDEKKDVTYNAAILENEYIKVEVLPEIGGKIQRALDKTTNYDFVYHNEVIKPAMVGLAGPWVSGGIEFNWPQHHRPTTYMPLEATITEDTDGEKTVWVGEVDPLYRMKGMAGISVPSGRSYVKAKVQVYNRTPYPQPIMWWANLAVEINKDYRVVFPPDVEWVNDHDRRAILQWPMAKGVYHTARPFDFGDGTDIHDVSAVRVPSSYLVSKGQCDMDFVCGYDEGKQCGVVTVADHHISPGKKMWHWGNHPFGDKWCANLTDNGSKYIELMTGVYTDNQPDFTWVMPYETRVFDQYWYPVKNIGEVKNATIDAAVNCEMRDGKLYLGYYATGVFEGCKIVVKEGNNVIFEDTCDLSPENTYEKYIDASVDYDKISATLTSADGKLLVGHKPYIRGNKKPIEPRKPALHPSEIETIEELVINGQHLTQYRHFAYEPTDYFLEALKRDPGESRANTAMGNYYLGRGEFEKAIEYYDKAIARLTLRNDNPADTEALYHKGLALRFLGKLDEAYDTLYRSAWQYNYMSGAYYALACIDCIRGDYELALEHLETSLSVNVKNLNALKLKWAITRDEAVQAQINALDPLFEVQCDKHEYYIDRAIDFMNAGFKDLAIAELEKADKTKPMVLYYLAYLKGDRALVEMADAQPWECCFPARLDDIAVLKWANTPKADYYLGCLYYDRRRYDCAIARWESAIRGIPTFGPAYRNLGIAYMDKKNDLTGALIMMHKAVELMPEDTRAFYELVQLYKNGNLSIDQRLALHDAHVAVSAQRDDCTLDKSILYTELGNYDAARDILLDHRFHTYEGGEGNLTRHHAWLCALRGTKALEEGNYELALKEFEAGYTFPLCYGEEKNYFAQESHLNYGMACAYEGLGDSDNAAKYLALACTETSAPTEISYFRALALYKSGNVGEGRALLQKMIEMGEAQIANKDVPAYYGVGSPTPMPFEYNFAERNIVKGKLLIAFGKLGLGYVAEAKQLIEEIKMLDRTNFGAYAFGVYAK